MANIDGHRSELRSLLQVLNRRKRWIVGCSLAVPAAVLSLLATLPPRYTAESVVMLDPPKERVIGPSPATTGTEAPPLALVASEAEAIGSYDMARQVSDRLDLAARQNELTTSPRQILAASVRRLWLELAHAAGLPAAGTIDHDVAAVLKKDVSVVTDGRSYVIKIQASAQSARLATDIADAYAETYLADQLRRGQQTAQRAGAWLERQVAKAREQLAGSERAVAEYREDNHVLDRLQASATPGELAELTAQLATAHSERTQKESAVAEGYAALKSGNLDALGEVTGSPLIQHLREQEAQLVAYQGNLESQFLPGYPKLQNQNAQIAALRATIEREAKKVLSRMKEAANAARLREEALRANVDAIEQQIAASDRAQVKLRELERRADADRQLYTGLLDKSKQIGLEAELPTTSTRLVSLAPVPRAPSFPNLTTALVGLVAGAAIGVLLAFVRERLDDSFHGSAQLRQASGLPVLGMLPELRTDRPNRAVLGDPTGVYAEAVRSVRCAVEKSAASSVVVVTSSVVEEGKTSFAASLACSAAMSGRRVLLIDCDLRRPAIAALFTEGAGREGADLASIASDGGTDALTQTDPRSGVRYIPVMNAHPSPQDVLGSAGMRAFLAVARLRYDLIVLDAPPVLAAADAAILAKIADVTLFLVRWGRTPASAVLEALEGLSAVGISARLVLSRVKARMHRTYRTGDSAYYYARYVGRARSAAAAPQAGAE